MTNLQELLEELKGLNAYPTEYNDLVVSFRDIEELITKYTETTPEQNPCSTINNFVISTQ